MPKPFTIEIGPDKFTVHHVDGNGDGVMNIPEKCEISVERAGTPPSSFKTDCNNPMFPKFVGLPVSKWLSAHSALIGSKVNEGLENAFSNATDFAVQEGVDLAEAKKLALRMIKPNNEHTKNEGVAAFSVSVIALSLKNNPLYRAKDPAFKKFVDTVLIVLQNGQLKIALDPKRDYNSASGTLNLYPISPLEANDRQWLVHELYYIYLDAQAFPRAVRGSAFDAYLTDSQYAVADLKLDTEGHLENHIRQRKLNELDASFLRLAWLTSHRPKDPAIASLTERVRRIIDLYDGILPEVQLIIERSLPALIKDIESTPNSDRPARVQKAIAYYRSLADQRQSELQAYLIAPSAKDNMTIRRHLNAALTEIISLYFLEHFTNQASKDPAKDDVNFKVNIDSPVFQRIFDEIITLGVTDYFFTEFDGFKK